MRGPCASRGSETVGLFYFQIFEMIQMRIVGTATIRIISAMMTLVDLPCSAGRGGDDIQSSCLRVEGFR